MYLIEKLSLNGQKLRKRLKHRCMDAGTQVPCRAGRDRWPGRQKTHIVRQGALHNQTLVHCGLQRRWRRQMTRDSNDWRATRDPNDCSAAISEWSACTRASRSAALLQEGVQAAAAEVPQEAPAVMTCGRAGAAGPPEGGGGGRGGWGGRGAPEVLHGGLPGLLGQQLGAAARLHVVHLRSPARAGCLLLTEAPLWAIEVKPGHAG